LDTCNREKKINAIALMFPSNESLIQILDKTHP